MERYIGMDVHAASCTLAVISEKGRKLKDFPVETNGQALVEAIRMIPGHKHLVFEEGLQSAWLYETLSPHVDELVVAGITTSRGPKSDKRDAYGLAEKLRVGNLDKYVFKSPRQFTMLREFSRTHMTLVTDVVRTQARIKSVYRSRGVLVTGIDVYGSRRREEWLKQLPSGTKIRATRLYTHLDFLLEQKKQAEADLLREGKKHPIVKILETAPGFGPIRAARLVPIVITPHRFRTKRQFWSYCGLGIVTRSSPD
jgi:transposase